MKFYASTNCLVIQNTRFYEIKITINVHKERLKLTAVSNCDIIKVSLDCGQS